MVTIHLKDVQIFGFHGIQSGEEKTGSLYRLNLEVMYEEAASDFENLESTIDYVSLFEIIKQRMGVSTPLLEKLAESIIRRIKHQYSSVREISISIYKLQAPIRNFQGEVGITMHKKFNV
ncbi:MAG TPA: dihydroneopterin aldolase [Flavitalea sp.]|nr:dihydroneopterin aldolase [Flavitalea sp.]